jgi:hypothetical protein
MWVLLHTAHLLHVMPSNTILRQLSHYKLLFRYWSTDDYIFYITFNCFIFIKMLFLQSQHLFHSFEYNITLLTPILRRVQDNNTFTFHWLTYIIRFILNWYVLPQFLQDRNPVTNQGLHVHLYSFHMPSQNRQGQIYISFYLLTSSIVLSSFRFTTAVVSITVSSGSLSPWHGASSGCGWRTGLWYGG